MNHPIKIVGLKKIQSKLETGRDIEFYLQSLKRGNDDNTGRQTKAQIDPKDIERFGLLQWRLSAERERDFAVIQ